MAIWGLQTIFHMRKLPVKNFYWTCFVFSGHGFLKKSWYHLKLSFISFFTEDDIFYREVMHLVRKKCLIFKRFCYLSQPVVKYAEVRFLEELDLKDMGTEFHHQEVSIQLFLKRVPLGVKSRGARGEIHGIWNFSIFDLDEFIFKA